MLNRVKFANKKTSNIQLCLYTKPNKQRESQRCRAFFYWWNVKMLAKIPAYSTNGSFFVCLLWFFSEVFFSVVVIVVLLLPKFIEIVFKRRYLKMVGQKQKIDCISLPYTRYTVHWVRVEIHICKAIAFTLRIREMSVEVKAGRAEKRKIKLTD